MFTLRRWWDRNALKLGLVSLVVGTAWVVRQTQGALVSEIYQGLTRPLQGSPPQVQAEDPTVRILQQRVAELESQNRQLNQALGYTAKLPGKGIFAPVIGRSADHWWQQVTLGRGSRDGIQVDAIVTSDGGLVGRVVQVTPHTSRVLLISDPSSKVGSVVSRSRNVGYVRGQSENRVVMEFVDKVPDVRPGDTIATSTLSRLYPSGLPIGTVESINLNKSPAPEASIKISAPISQLEWVVVYVSLKPIEEAPIDRPQNQSSSRSTPADTTDPGSDVPASNAASAPTTDSTTDSRGGQ